MGNYRISVPIVKGSGTRSPGDTTPPVESYDLDQKVRAAIAAGAFMGLATAVILTAAWGILLLLAAAVEMLPPTMWIVGIETALLGISLVFGVLVACQRGYEWSVKAASRAWDVDDAEIRLRRAREKADIEAQEAAVKAAKERTTRGDDTDGNPLTLTDQQRLDMVAINMLERVYAHAQPERATRDIMTQDGVCMQFEWNLVNKGMKAIGVREKKSWQALGFQQAWILWRENVKLETDGDGDRYLMVLKPNGNWHALERVE